MSVTGLQCKGKSSQHATIFYRTDEGDIHRVEDELEGGGGAGL
jgi:hypothetical protein